MHFKLTPIPEETQKETESKLPENPTFEKFVNHFIETYEEHQVGFEHKPYHLQLVQNNLDKLFLEVLQYRTELTMAEGMRAIGGKVTQEKCEYKTITTIEWMTDFCYPGAQYKNQMGKVAVLGYFKEYDLYIGFQEPLPPTLIARFGNNPEDYYSYNSFLLGEPKEELFIEAFNRAKLTNRLRNNHEQQTR